MPKISVIMPTYNAQEYLKEAMDSILNQTFADFEFLIIDDNSNDKTLEIINSYNDNRIRLIQGPNKGISAALNLGIKESKGQFIARMDADDVSLPQRFEKQLEVFEKYPDIAILGTKAKLISNTPLEYEYFVAPFFDNRPELFYIGILNVLNTCVICHPTVMFRKELLLKNNLFYNENYKAGEDQELWTRAVLCVRMANLNISLLNYRFHQTNATTKNIKDGYVNVANAKAKLLEHLLPYNNAKVIDLEQFEFDTLRINAAIDSIGYPLKQMTKLAKGTHKNNFAQNIFSLKNSKDKKHKIITILGVKIKFKKKKEIR